MLNLSENYYLRKCYMKEDKVPTQSMIKKKMRPPLAAVYFKSMTPRLKEIAGLEPPLKGGGTDWYVPPEELLKGRTVLKPIKRKVLDKLNHDGVDIIGMKLFEQHRNMMETAINDVLLDADINWRKNIDEARKQYWEDFSADAKKENGRQIADTFNSFVSLYRTSLSKIENLFKEAAIIEINKTREDALSEMQNKFKIALKTQATSYYDEYQNKLTNEKNRLKEEFIKDLEICRTDMANKIHDLNVDKYMAIEKLRQLLECQNLACRIYVALKEREECSKEMEESKHLHKKKAKVLSDKMAFQQVEILLAERKERRRHEFYNVWKKKVCHVIKKFQTFVSYCLKMLPDHAEFFINLEKLMLLQVDEALEEPNAESIIIIDKQNIATPVPQPKPFYLFCDRGYKSDLNQDLCPKRSASSASQLPVIIINKRCIYAACDNFEQFTNKIKHFIQGSRGDDADFKDDHIYEYSVPVKLTSSQQQLEFKLESSLLQVLNQEIVYEHTDEVSDKCRFCQLRQCKCSSLRISESNKTMKDYPLKAKSSESSYYSHSSMTKIREFEHEKGPKWESFFAYVEPKKCECGKTTKKQLKEHFPPYMRRMTYGPPEIPDYETCSVQTLKAMVKKYRKEKITIPAAVVPPKTKDTGTQYFDPEFEIMCTCFSDNEVDHLLDDINIDTKLLDSSKRDESKIKDLHKNVSLTYMTQRASSFALARASSLRNLVDDIPDLQEIFKQNDCDFE